MSIQITHVRFGGLGRRRTRSSHTKWKSEQTGEVKHSDKPTLVAWIDNGGKAYVGAGSARVAVGVVRPQNGQPYLRTHADVKWTNNLVSLLTF